MQLWAATGFRVAAAPPCLPLILSCCPRRCLPSGCTLTSPLQGQRYGSLSARLTATPCIEVNSPGLLDGGVQGNPDVPLTALSPPSSCPTPPLHPPAPNPQIYQKVAFKAIQTVRSAFDKATGYNHSSMTEAQWLRRMLFLETVAGG